jgi:gamma-D-glutamyl-L-lysine dipeptidyl-peptidase
MTSVPQELASRSAALCARALEILFVVVVLTACAVPLPLPPPPAQPVSVQPAAVQPPPEPIAPGSVPHGQAAVQTSLPVIEYTVQAGAFSTSQRAAHLADRLSRNGVDAYYFVDGDGLYKVRFERFATVAAARSRAVLLQSKGLIGSFYIVQPADSGHSENPQLSLREKIVNTASRFIGTPYRWGGASPRVGFDCSGLTVTVYRLNSLELPRSARAQYHTGSPVSRESLEPGDLVFFATNGSGRVSHVGIYSGNGKFIHAPGRGKVIGRATLSNNYYKRHYVGARRYF